MAEAAAEPAAPPPVPVVEADGKFDLESYIANYSGHTKVARLLFIIERCPELVPEALPLAIRALKEGDNTQQYRLLFDKYAAQLESLGESIDAAWMSGVDKQAEVMQGKLENQLSTSKSGVDKEATRVAHQKNGGFLVCTWRYCCCSQMLHTSTRLLLITRVDASVVPRCHQVPHHTGTVPLHLVVCRQGGEPGKT